MRRERGTSLIFVLGILALLSLFAISFATVTRVERTASANYVDEVRARLAARAGLSAGIAAAHEAFKSPAPKVPALGGFLDGVHVITAKSGTTITLANPTGIGPGDVLTLYGGASNFAEDVTVAGGYVPGTNPVTLTSTPSAGARLYAVGRGGAWSYRGHSRNPAPTGNGIPLSVALSAGTGTGAGHGAPSLIVATGPSLNPTLRFASGSTGGTYFADPPPAGTPYLSGGDVYGTKILDTSGMLDANMDQTELAAILPQFGTDVLAEISAIVGAVVNDFPSATALNKLLPRNDPGGTAYANPFGTGANVTNFFAYRDKLSGKRFRSKEQLKGAFYAMSGGDAAKAEAWFTLFRDYMSCFGDYEGNDCLGDEPQGAWNPPGGIPLTGGAPDVTQIFQNKKKSQTAGASRAAVNVNTAPIPVLVAVLQSVRARGLPACVPDPNAQAVTPISINAGIVPMAPYPAAGNGTVTALTHADAVSIARVLVAGRPYRSWNEIYRVLNTYRATPATFAAVDPFIGNPAPADEVLAAALVATCPVDLPLSINPDRSLLYWDATNPDDPTPANVGFKVAAEKAGTHSAADLSFTSGYFEIESMGRVYANPTAPYVVAEASRRCVVNIGGVVWIRGQRDLSGALPGGSGLMGAPALSGNSAYVGGWIQPKPADGIATGNGIQVPGGVVSAGASLSPFQGNTADGFLVQRTQWVGTNSNVVVAHATSSPAAGDDKGQAEMWVKQPFDAGQGSNEALFMNIRNYDPGYRHSEPGFTEDPDSAATISQIGVATRLERFGNKLYFCRFFWGYPDGASPAKIGEDTDGYGNATAANPTTKYINNMHGYITTPALNWKAGTWHHVLISWNVMTLKMYVDGEDMGAASLPPEYKGGVVWEQTVQGFYPTAGTGGLDPNNQFADPNQWPRDGSKDDAVNTLEQNAKNHQISDTNAMNAMPIGSQVVTNPQWKALKDHRDITDQKVIDDAEEWRRGGNGGFATDVAGMTFTAQLGLRRMKLRTHLPIPGVPNGPGADGITESYFLGYKTPDPYNNESPAEIVTLNFKFGNPGTTGSFYHRYCNGTYDALKWSQTPGSAPTPMPHRYNQVDPSVDKFDLAVTLPVGYRPVAHGYHIVIAHDAFAAADMNPDTFGGGRTDTMSVAGQVVTVSKTFPAGNPQCNVLVHQGHCNVPGSNEVPWACGGAWIAYEKPTTFLEAPEVD